MKRIIMLLLILILLYLLFSCYTPIESLVPFNSYEAPNNSPTIWNQSRDKFGTLIQTINSTNYAVSYNINNQIDALKKVLNSQNIGKFNILSIQDTKPYTLFNVIIQDVDTFAVIRFARVDYMIDSVNPFIIKNIKVTLDNTFTSNQFVQGLDSLQNDTVFRIKNPLHLFAPYDTSDNENIVSTDDIMLMQNVIAEKEKILETY
jgi:hypothetical protein